MNDCDSSPCIHGGTCTDRLGRFDCECPQDYAGRQCELGNNNNNNNNLYSAIQLLFHSALQ